VQLSRPAQHTRVKKANNHGSKPIETLAMLCHGHIVQPALEA
jgi:hypothetical protein